MVEPQQEHGGSLQTGQPWYQDYNNPTVVYQNGDKNVHIDHVDVLNI